MARLRILTDLHWSQRRPLSSAETRFSTHVLPELEDTAAALQRDVRVRVPNCAFYLHCVALTTGSGRASD